MRVYEIAKMLNLSNKEILTLLIDEGFDVKSHMAALPDEAIAFLEKKLEKKKVKEALISDHRANQQVLEPTVEVESRSQPKQGKIEFQKNESVLRQEETPVQNEFIVKAMTVGEFAEFAKKPLGEIILLLLKQGIICAKNQMLPEKTIEYLAKYFDYEIKFPE
jgi:translation initiation factor IF-2